MRLLITRHSKTQWNQERRLQGRKDSPLSAQGLEDARILGEYLKNEAIDEIYSSPLGRAQTTARTIFPHQEIILDDNLVEMSFGQYEGENVAKLIKQDDYYNLWHQPSDQSALPGGESYGQVRERMIAFVEKLKSESPDKTVFVVTHGMAFIVLLGVLEGLATEEFTKINQEVVRGCSLSEVAINGDEITVIKVGDSSFLPSDNLVSFNK